MTCPRCNQRMGRETENDFTCDYCGNVVNRTVLTQIVNHPPHRYYKIAHPRVWSEERKQAARDRLRYYSAIFNEQRKQEAKRK
jgi:tRNA(Ile2) C34 agmatinyltransferase TiaS